MPAACVLLLSCVLTGSLAGPAPAGATGCLPELIVADPDAQAHSAPGQGALYSLLMDEDGPPRVRPQPVLTRLPAIPMGPIARADIDRDGCVDLVVGSPSLSAVPLVDSPDFGYSPEGDGYAQIVWGGEPEPGRFRPSTTLVPALAGLKGHFGWSVAASAGVVAVGAPYEDAPEAADSGAVYVFRLRGREVLGTPRRVTQDSPGVQGNGETGDLFGWSLALGSLGGDPARPDLAVGAPYETDDGAGRQETGVGTAQAGAVTVLRDVDAQATPRGEQFRLPSAGARFGYALASGAWEGSDWLAAGAPGVDTVRLFATPAGGELLPVRDIRGHGAYGFSLALTGGDLVIGAPYGVPPYGAAPGSGTVTVTSLDGDSVALTRGAGPRDRFGWAVAGAGAGWVLAGAPDRGTTGSVALVPMGGGETVWLAPGDGYVPQPPGLTARRRPHEISTAVDFGGSVG